MTNKFDFSLNWVDVDPATQDAFARKCAYIENEALRRIAKKHNIRFSEIEGSCIIDAETEWDAADTEVSDEDWLDAVIDSFEVELREKGYLPAKER